MEEIEALEIHRSYSGMKPSKKILYAGVGMVCLTLLFGCGDGRIQTANEYRRRDSSVSGLIG